MKSTIQWLKNTWPRLVAAFKYWPVYKYLYKRWGFKRAFYNVLFRLFCRGEHAGARLLDPLVYILSRDWPLTYMFEIETTTLCNLQCPVCDRTYWKSGKDFWMRYDDPSQPMDFKRMMDRLPPMIYFNPTGIGSFFLNPDHKKIMEDVKKRGLTNIIIDHAANLTEEQMDWMIDIGVDRYIISFDGATKETYNQMRVGADFDRTVANIKKLCEKRRERNSPLPEIMFKYILAGDTVEEAPQFVDFVADNFSHNGIGDDLMIEFIGLLYFKEIERYDKRINPEIEKRAIARSKERKIKIVYSHHTKDKRKLRDCVVWYEPYIIEGRYVIPCCGILENNDRDWLRENALGDLTKNTFWEIWNSNRYRDLRDQIYGCRPIDVLCSKCRTFNVEKYIKKNGIAYDCSKKAGQD